MTSTCSFRITRTAEDLAQTINALSQRLVKLEQRQEALELRLSQGPKEPSTEEMQMLDGIDQLLRECQELLDAPSESNESQDWCSENDEETSLAA